MQIQPVQNMVRRPALSGPVTYPAPIIGQYSFTQVRIDRGSDYLCRIEVDRLLSTAGGCCRNLYYADGKLQLLKQIIKHISRNDSGRNPVLVVNIEKQSVPTEPRVLVFPIYPAYYKHFHKIHPTNITRALLEIARHRCLIGQERIIIRVHRCTGRMEKRHQGMLVTQIAGLDIAQACNPDTV